MARDPSDDPPAADLHETPSVASGEPAFASVVGWLETDDGKPNEATELSGAASRVRNGRGINVHFYGPGWIAIHEDTQTIGVGDDVPPAGLGGVDHHLFVSDEGGSSPEQLDNMSTEGTVHVVPGAGSPVGDRVKRACRDADASARIHPLSQPGAVPMTPGDPSPAGQNRLDSRVQILGDGRGMVGVRYGVPQRTASGEPFADEAPELLILPDADDALAAAEHRDSFESASPDLVVAPRATGEEGSGTLVEAFSDADALLLTGAAPATESRARASEHDVRIGRVDTGRPLTLGFGGYADHQLDQIDVTVPDSSETPDARGFNPPR